MIALGLFAFPAAASAAVTSDGPSELPECGAKPESITPLSPAYLNAQPKTHSVTGGGQKVTYAMSKSAGPEASTMTFNVPPKGFKPLEASAEELQRYGFPPRPADGSSLAQWEELVGGFKEAIAPAACRNGPVESSLPSNSISGGYYSGFGAFAPHENTNEWHAVIGTFYQLYPTAYPSCEGAAVSTWVGMGGYYTNRFIQTGTVALSNGELYPFIEIYAGQWSEQIPIPGFPVEGGAYMKFYVGYNPSIHEAYFYATNEWAGKTVLTQFPLGPQFYDGSTAWWITERPTYRYTESRYPLLNYNTVNWFADTAQNEANQVLPIGALPHSNLSIRNGRRVLSSTSALSSEQNFSNYYHECR